MNAQQSLQTTPPQSSTGPPTPPQSFTSPPTPPATEEKTSASITQILAVVRRHRDGHSLPADEHWLRFSLGVYQYSDLPRQLRQVNLWDHYEHNLRCVKGTYPPLPG